MITGMSSTPRNVKKNDGIQESASQNSVTLPPHTMLLNHQIGGHIHGNSRTSLGLLKHENGDVLKPLRPGVRKDSRELAFYEKIFDSTYQDSLILELISFVPSFKGTWTGHLNGEDIKYMCLGDITEQFKVPCNMDIKIGAQTYDPEASDEKRKCENKKFPAGQILAFRIVGMKVFSESTQGYFIIDRSFGKMQTPETIVDALHLYFDRGYWCFVWAVLAAFIHRLKALEDWFSMQRKLAFYSSSLLFLYEGDHRSWITWFQGKEDLLPYLQHSDISDYESHCTSPLNVTPLQGTGVSPSAEDHTTALHSSVPLSSCQSDSDYTCTSCSVCGLQKEICHEIVTDCSLYDVRMIDFAHVFPSESEDANYLFGLRNLTVYLKSLLQKVVNARH